MRKAQGGFKSMKEHAFVLESLCVAVVGRSALTIHRYLDAFLFQQLKVVRIGEMGSLIALFMISGLHRLECTY